MHSSCHPYDLLSRAAIEVSPNRKQILTVLINSKQALSPKIILDKLRRTRTFDKVTLYRILDLLVKKKVLRKIAAHDGSARYEIMCSEHHPVHAHFICRMCARIECLEDNEIDKLMNMIKKIKFRMFEGVDLKFEGLCLSCQKQNSRRRQ